MCMFDSESTLSSLKLQFESRQVCFSIPAAAFTLAHSLLQFSKLQIPKDLSSTNQNSAQSFSIINAAIDCPRHDQLPPFTLIIIVVLILM